MKDAAGSAYLASHIKRKRRTRTAIDSIKQAAYEIAEQDQPCTVRQLFYRLVSRGVIGKTENEYQSTVIRLIKQMRQENELPWSWITDATRWVRRPRTHNSVLDLLSDCADTYRRALWRDQPTYVEVWCEKDALAGVFVQVTDPFDVPLMVSRGYPSLTYLMATAEALQEQGKPCYLFQFGDHDPSGVDIPRHIETKLRQFAPDVELHFERVAVTPEQIDEWQLPTRPTKKTDSRAKSFAGASVDVDAISPNQLRELCRSCIVQHIDTALWNRAQRIEDQERASIGEIAERFRLGSSEAADAD